MTFHTLRFLRARKAAWLAAILGSVLLAARLCAATPSDADGDGVPDSQDKCPSTPSGRAVDENGCCSAARALVLGVGNLAKVDPSQPGDAMVALHLRKLYPHPGLDRFIERAREIFADAPAVWCILPGRPLVKIPQPMPRGIIRWVFMMETPHAEPKDLAQALLSEYLLTKDCAGYVLTHQMLALQTAKSVGMTFPQEITDRIPSYLAAIDAEQRADPKFGDLFAERAMILLLYASPKRSDADQWIETIIAAQSPDGSWSDERVYPVSYQGHNETVRPEMPHASALSAYSVALYLARFGAGTPRS